MKAGRDRTRVRHEAPLLLALACALTVACGSSEPSDPAPDGSFQDAPLDAGQSDAAVARSDAARSSADAQSDRPGSSDATVAIGPSDASVEVSLDAGVPTRSVGCSTGTGLPDGPATFDAGGLARKYVVRKPAAYSGDRAWPLVLALHPNGSNTSYWDGTTGDRALRPLLADKAVLIIPQARVDDWRGDLPSDLAYFDTLIDKVESALCIDEARIFSMGFSGGGSFSGVLGCARTDIRAIAVGGAVEYFDPKTCIGTPAAWITIGDDEAITDRIKFRDFWRSYDSCETTSVATDPSPCVAYACPDAKRPVQFCSHPGGHEWPSFGTDAAWKFFAQF